MRVMIDLDGFDLRLLACLQQDGRLTNQQLGDQVGLSASQCSRRRVALEETGVIEGYRARLSATALGFGITVLIQVTLSKHSRENASHFRDLVRGVDAIQEAYAMTGDPDYVLKAVLPGLPDLAALVNDVLLPSESVGQVRSSLVLEKIKESDGLPVSAVRRR